MKTTCAFLIVISFSVNAGADEPQKKPKPKFTISKETTYITEPLDKDGYPDYAAALNARLSKGVTPENNANVLIWKALGPKPEGKSIPEGFFKLMGMEVPPEKGEYFVSLHTFASDNLKLNPPERRRIEDQLRQVESHPWKEREFPEIAAWLKHNEKPLAIFLAASKRTHYYSPLVPTLSEDGLPDLATALIAPGILPCRHVASAFACRAMLLLAKGRDGDARQDLLACHRLGRHIGRGGLFIDSAVGISIDSFIVPPELAFLELSKVDARTVQVFFDEIRVVPPLPNIGDIIDFGERLFVLEQTMNAARGGLVRIETALLLEEGEFGKVLDKERLRSKPNKETESLLNDIDWDRALRQTNRGCDSLAAALRESNREKRRISLEALVEESFAQKKDLPKANDLVKTLVGLKVDPAAKSEFIRKVFTCPIETTCNIARSTDRAEQTQRNLHLAFALAIYQRENGKYPNKLEALSPKYLAKIPNDLFTGKPLVFRPSEKGYLLYSFGPDGKDNEGRSHFDDPWGDDISVRMPLPSPKAK